MATKFLWISKDATSQNLSRSSRSEEAVIRRHVQRKRTERLAKKYHRMGSLRPPALSAMPDLRTTERRSLEYFVHRTAIEWSGWQDGAFWNGLALQASQQNLAIAHGLVALAAWHESSSTLTSDPESASRLGRLAVVQHGMASELLSNSRSLNHSTSLISCVILASLQSYGGQYQEYRLLRAGEAILNEALMSVVPGADGDSMSATDQVSQEVRPLISRLQERLCMMGDMPAALARSARYHMSRRHARQDLPILPTTFGSLRDARDCLECILKWGHDHVVEAQNVPESWKDFHMQLVENIKLWEDGLDAITLSKAHEESTVNLLKIAALNGMALLLTCCSPKETEFDLHNAVFRRIMALVMQIAGSYGRHGRVSFGIDCGLIDIVAFVGSRCRDSKIRRTALDWLRDSTRIEGQRLSSETGQIVQAWIELEERGGTCQSVIDPEAQRRRLLAGERYHAQHLTKVLFVSYPYDLASGAVVDEIWICTDDTGTAYAENLSASSPDAIFSPGHAAFFDFKQNTFHHLDTTNFYFPIPRV
jgi:hypothetical protein